MTKIIFRSLRALTFICFVSLSTCIAGQADTSAPTATGPVARSRPADSPTATGSTSVPEPARNQQRAPAKETSAVARAGEFGESPDPSTTKTGAPDGEATAQTSSSTKKWEFQFVPYLWFAGIKGQVGIGDRIADVDAGFGDIIDQLNFGFMGAFEARKGKFSLLTDLLYLKVSAENATPGALFSSVKATQKVFILEEDVGYRL